MDLAVLIATALFLSLSDDLFIRYKHIVHKNRTIVLKGIIPHGWKQIVCFVLIPMSLLSVALMMHLFYAKPLLYTIKRMCVVSVLWPIAIFDYREYRIPNKLLLFGFCLRIPILILELVFDRSGILATVISEGCAIVGSAVICLICMLLLRGSLGMGDLKLFLFMSAFLGVEGICYTMFVSVFFSAILSIGLLVFKKKSRKDTIPFAPFVLLGTLVCLILTGV